MINADESARQEWSRGLLRHGQHQLENLSSFADLERWRDLLIEPVRDADGHYDCAICIAVRELNAGNDAARATVIEHFAVAHELLRDAIAAMRDHGLLRPETDSEALATAAMAAVQGGLLLASASRDAAPVSAALEMAVEQIRRYSE
jgi:TetR/AcrR family transcriptional regulator, transcriptional repressor for nem operon